MIVCELCGNRIDEDVRECSRCQEFVCGIEEDDFLQEGWGDGKEKVFKFWNPTLMERKS